MKKISSSTLWETVIKNDYCSGCGVCTATKNSPFKMSLNEKGYFIPKIVGDLSKDDTVICPFGSHNIDEDILAKEQFDEKDTNYNSAFGYYKKLYAGFVNEGDFRIKGSSGGSVSWMTNQLLKEDLVDYIVHIKETNTATRYNYSISCTVEENNKGAKSRYYPTTMESVLDFIKNNDGRYAIISIPCFIKGINLLKTQNELFKKRITFTISLFCGHLKTTHYLDSLVSQFDISTKDVEKFDFRHKIETRKASDYGTELVLKNGEKKMKLNKDLFGTDWGLGLFKLKACDYCDDVIGETADISFGDAWIPKYEDDYLGTNVVVTRHQILDKIISKAIKEQRVSYENLDSKDLYASQAGGFRHRREGLAHRLFLMNKKNVWTPKKRVSPKEHESKKRRNIFKLRMILQEKSINSSNYKNVSALKKELKPYLNKIKNVNRHSAWTRMVIKIKTIFKKK